MSWDLSHVWFDLEFLGDLNDGTDQCSIYEIAAINEDDVVYQEFCDPCPGEPIIPVPFHKECFRITRGYINEHNIDTVAVVLGRFVEYLASSITGDSNGVVLLSHGCFRSDKPILMHTVLQNAIEWPRWVRFADTLQLSRVCLLQQPSYRLCDLYVNLVGCCIKEPHSATYDAMATKSVVGHMWDWQTRMVHYSLHDPPLSNVKHIGAKTELKLVSGGFFETLNIDHYTFLNEPQRKSLHEFIVKYTKGNTDNQSF